VLVFAGVLFTARLGARSPWSEEVRWAEIPREMEQSGRWFWPTFNGRTYYDKPLGSYWLVMLARRIPGISEETAARLPCALAGFLSVALVTSLARRCYGGAAAPLAGLVAATSFSFVFFARHASADMETVAGMLAALWLFLRYEHRPDGWWSLPFWLMMALTSLTKGLLGFALPCVVIGSYRASQVALPRWTGREIVGWLGQMIRAQTWFFHRKTGVGIALAAAVYVSPFVVSVCQTGSNDGLAMVFRENVRRFIDPVNHRGPVYLYALVIFELMAPWSLVLPAALWHAHADTSTTQPRPDGQKFALAFFWSIFVFFTLSASRRSYYLLPIVPAGGLVVSGLLVDARPSLSRATRWLLLGMRPSRTGWVCGIAAIFGMTAIYLIALPAAEPLRTRRLFADAVRLHVQDLDDLALYDEHEVAYYFAHDRLIQEYDTVEALDEARCRGKVRWVLTRQTDLEQLRGGFQPVVWEAEQPWESKKQSRAKLVLLERARDAPKDPVAGATAKR
jgi:4-amino-4-deoxy-L-arabinose transferase-like glycosyltransferase